MTGPDLRPLRMGEMLDVAIKVTTRNLWTLVRTVAIVVVPLQIVSVLVTISATPEQAELGTFGATGAEPTTDELTTFLVAQIVVLVLTLVAGMLASGAALKAIGDAYVGEEPEWRSSLRFGLRRLHSLVWVGFLRLFIPSLLFGLAAGIALGLIALSDAVIVLAVPAGFGLMAAVVFVGAVYFLLGLTIPILLIDDVKGVKAVRRAFRLSRRRFWRTTTPLFVMFLLVSVIQLIITGIPSVAIVAIDNEVAAAVVTTITGIAGALIATPLEAAILAVVFFDLRVRREGLDVAMLADTIGVDPTGAGVPLLPPARPSTSLPPPPVAPGPPPPPPPPGVPRPPVVPPAPGPDTSPPAPRPPDADPAP
ncbi:MAG: hypothetical protein R3A49_12875 [Acidimicrobiia bacterium]